MYDPGNSIKTYELHFEERENFPIELHCMDFNLHSNTFWWKMPLYYSMNDIKIPVIEFQYKAWLPNSEIIMTHQLLRIEVHSIYRSVNSEMFNQILLRNSSRPPRVSTPPIRPGTVQRVSQPIRNSTVRPLVLPQTVGQIILHNARLGSEECPITSTRYSEIAHLSVTSCFHVFETDSIEQWRETHSTCPVCRTEIINLVSE